MRINKMFINGEWIGSTNTQIRNDLFRGTPYSETSLSDMNHVKRALAAAEQGAIFIEKAPAHQRATWLRNAAEMLRRDEIEIASCIVSENGKSIKLCRLEVQRAAETLEFSANEALRHTGEVIPLDASPRGDKKLGFYMRVPVGIVACITPFNFPLNLLAHKVGPALATGNAVIAKPDPRTATSAVHLFEKLIHAGIPPLSVNLLHGGAEIGEAIVTDPRVGVVSFTGGKVAGERITSLAGIKRVVLELGGNAGNIICRDANLTLAARAMATNAFGFSGQSCIGVQRIYVEETISKPFLDNFISETSKLHVGDPWDEATEVGPMISEQSADRVIAWINEAVRDGAKLLLGGGRKGLIVEPTILIDVTATMKVVCEEVFGPVAAVITVSDLDAAIKGVNDSRYGLQAGVFTESLSNALKCIRQIKAGGVVINGTSNFRLEHQPYGGVKLSGIGREGPHFAVDEMTQVRMVIVN